MTRKDINIHVKVKGKQAKKQLDDIGKGAKGVGKAVEKTGRQSESGGKKIAGAFAKLAGPLGIAGLATMLGGAAIKVAGFFDSIKTSIDQASGRMLNLRRQFDELFEAFNAFDEKSRQSVTTGTVNLLQKTGVSAGIGLPIINAYKRQFGSLVDTGVMHPNQYDAGLEGMLGYGVRHGGAATSDLIGMMAGWGMTTPQKQGDLRRMIAAGAASSGLTDAELIGALGRGLPTIKAMGWTPSKAIESIGVLAFGEAGRRKMSLPASTIQALGAPQVANAEKFGIAEAVATDPQKLFGHLQKLSRTTPQKDFYRMLTQLYSLEGAAGAYKLMTIPRGPIRGALTGAVGQAGIEAELQEELSRMQTRETVEARTEAYEMHRMLDVSGPEFYSSQVRKIGKSAMDVWGRKRPVREGMRRFFAGLNEAEKEDAAFRLWKQGLSDEQKREITQSVGVNIGTLAGPAGIDSYPYIEKWRGMSPQQRHGALTDVSRPSSVVNNHYHNEIIYNPVVGSDERGARLTQD